MKTNKQNLLQGASVVFNSESILKCSILSKMYSCIIVTTKRNIMTILKALSSFDILITHDVNIHVKKEFSCMDKIHSVFQYQSEVIYYKQRLLKIGLLPLCYWYEFLDLVYVFKCL